MTLMTINSTISRAAMMLLMVLTMTVQTAWAQSTFSGGDGSQGNPYKIASTADLDQLAIDVYSGTTYEDTYFELTADIAYDPNALTTDNNHDGIIDGNFMPIGFGGMSFSGKFYGNGHTISNIVVTGDYNVGGRGLFGKTEGATLDGITVSGIVYGKADYVGGLVGTAVGTTITNCHVNCTVSSTKKYTGGLAGSISEGTTIDGCSAEGTVTSTSSNTGGLVGHCGEGTCTIRNSTTDVDVTGNDVTGGFLGYVNVGNLTISDCRADCFLGRCLRRASQSQWTRHQLLLRHHLDRTVGPGHRRYRLRQLRWHHAP